MDWVGAAARESRISIVLSAFLLGAAACGTGSSTPTAPTTALSTPTPGSLTISGAKSTNGVGTSQQLTATFKSSGGATSDVTAAATWLSDAPAVARVTSAGLVTTVALGTATVTATYQGQSGTARVSVATGSGPIAGCAELSGSGSYTLPADIPHPAYPCLSFTDGGSGQLDCAGHDLGSLSLANIQNFTVRNCLMHGSVTNGTQRTGLNVRNAMAIVVDASDVQGFLAVQSCVACIFSNNTFALPLGVGAESSVVVLFEGQNNQVVRNTVDGGWDGNVATWGKQGADDGILIQNEANILIEDNVVRRVYDAGIEATTYPQTMAVPVTATIRNNRIDHAGFTGIGGYYVAGWENSVFSGNIVSASPNLLTLVMNVAGAPEHGVTLRTMSLVNNQFVNNTLLNAVNLPPNYGGGQQPAAYINFQATLPGTISGNVFQNNNLGMTFAAPVLLPAGGFIDGGGNICQAGGSLTCAASARATFRSPR